MLSHCKRKGTKGGLKVKPWQLSIWSSSSVPPIVIWKTNNNIFTIFYKDLIVSCVLMPPGLEHQLGSQPFYHTKWCRPLGDHRNVYLGKNICVDKPLIHESQKAHHFGNEQIRYILYKNIFWPKYIL